MNSLSELLFGPLNLPAPLPGDAPGGITVTPPGGFAQSLTDARAALGRAVPGPGGSQGEPAPELPPAGAQSPPMPELAGAGADLQRPSLPGLPQPQAQPAPLPEQDLTEPLPSAAATPANQPAMLSAAARGPWALRLAVRATTTAGTGQGSPGGNGLPLARPDGGKALPGLPPALVQPHPAAVAADPGAAADNGVPVTPGRAAAAVMAPAVAQQPGVPVATGVPVAQTLTPTTTHIEQRATAGLAAPPAAEAPPPVAQAAAVLARLAHDRGALAEARLQSMQGEARLPGSVEVAQRAAGAADAAVARTAPAVAQPSTPTQAPLPGTTTATAAGQPPPGAAAPQASAASAAPAAAAPANAAAPPTAMPEGSVERAAAAAQPGDVARQLGAVELRALDPTAQGAADARRPVGADLLNQGQPGPRQDMAAQVDSGMVAAMIDRRTITDAAGQRRGAEQQAGAGTESVDRSPFTGSEAAEQISRPQTARPVVPVLAARDLSALAERIEMLMHRRSGVANVNLTLSELGDVEISVRMESRQAHVQFLVQDAAARESLEAQLPRLRALLSEGGLELGDIGMNMRERSGGDSGGERGDDPTGSPRRPVADGGAVEEPSPRRRSGGGDHVLDAFA